MATATSDEGPLAVAEAMDLLALALGTGAAVVTAVEAVADRAGPVVAVHLRHVAAALRWGVEPTVAWDGLPRVWRPAAQAMALAAIAGVAPGSLLRRAADDVREAERRRLEESAARLSVRIVVPLGLCFLPAFGLLTVIPVVAALASGLLTGGP
ncbi:type II secretion system F family protein [Luteipulveratus halotolerans]|uniref:type II secretion system F family protein n=1 Tax=Luteipulveratus halotolerans TaxID=1631356 RepID=UPI0018D06A0C|nr:type II secretion system F family protein [Luteipulveratus halotolerans]